MQFAVISTDGLTVVFRWFHYFFGVIWIGLLYYFNFVQGAFFAETDASTKSNAIQKLVPRALWWFRWGAFWTVVAGLGILAVRGQQSGFAVFASSWGIFILTGATMGIIMACNVWFVIWPAQKIVIESTTSVAKGGQPLPNAASAGARGSLASRTNVLFSIPLLFFMGAASHLPMGLGPHANYTLLGIVLGVIILAIELNALKGKMGPLTTVKGVIHMGFALTVVLYVIMEVLTKV